MTPAGVPHLGTPYLEEAMSEEGPDEAASLKDMVVLKSETYLQVEYSRPTWVSS